MAEHLLVFSMGPVQGFIAAARRGRDLWFASWLLSELARAAGRAAQAHLVMPTAKVVAEPESAVSNKLLLHIRGGDPSVVAAEMEQAARAALREIRERAFADLPPDLIDLGRACAQVDDVLEVAWASADVRPERGYREARRTAEALLAARKAIRPFSQPSWAGNAPKSSLDGERESVLRTRSARQLQRLGIGPTEHLCGVGLLKRRGHVVAQGHPGGRVLSTSHVASWSLRSAFAEAGPFQRACREAFVAHEAQLRALGAELSRTPTDDPVLGPFDGHLLYESRLRDLFPKDAVDAVAEARRATRGLWTRWRDLAVAHGVALPALSPYYAVLLADGDRMGAAIDAIGDPELHREVTAALEEFAGGARGIVDAHHGHCVYAGGDDVLALLPVTTAIACACALNEDFGKVAEAFASVDAPRPTLSVGIAVAHHVAPLADALDGAKEAERHAKQRVGRDAWAVRVDKRGGAPVLAGGKWCQVTLLTRAVEVMARLGVTRSLPHEVGAIAVQLAHNDLHGVRRAELRRVLTQKDLAPDLFDEDLGADVDLKALADRLLVARALSGMEGDDDPR